MTESYQAPHHSFNVQWATDYGVHEAILIHHFQFWIEHNQKMNRNFYEGRTWMYQTFKEIAAWFPYLTENEVRELLVRLTTGKGRRAKGEKEFEPILITGNFNKTKFDKTTWYAFKNEKMFTKGLKPTSDVGLSPDQYELKPTPIPDTKTDTKTKLASLDPSDPCLVAESSEVYEVSSPPEHSPQQKKKEAIASPPKDAAPPPDRKKCIKILENLGLNQQTHERLARVYPYADLVKAVNLAHKRKGEIDDINAWLPKCLQFRYWEKAEASPKEKNRKYYELLKNAYRSLQEEFWLWDELRLNENEIYSYNQNLGCLQAKYDKVKTKAQLKRHLDDLNARLPDIARMNLGKELIIRLELVTIDGEEKINITGE